MKQIRILALTVPLVALMASAASAVPDPGAGWSLLDTQKVRYFLPGNTPPADGTPADTTTAEALKQGSSLSANEWYLVGTENVRYFVPDGGTTGAQIISSTYVGTRTDSESYYVGRSGKVVGASYQDNPVDEADSSKWQVTTYDNGTRRYRIPRYQKTYKPYTIYEQYGTRTRQVTTNSNTYRKDADVVSTGGGRLIDTRTFAQNEDTFGSWMLSGVQANLNKVYSSGIDQAVAEVAPLVYTYSPSSVSTMTMTSAGGSQDSLAGRSNGTGKVTVSNTFVNTERSRMAAVSAYTTSAAKTMKADELNQVQKAQAATMNVSKTVDSLEQVVDALSRPAETQAQTNDKNTQSKSGSEVTDAKKQVLEAYLACEDVLKGYKDTFDKKYGSDALKKANKQAYKDAVAAYKKAAKTYKKLFDKNPPRYKDYD